MTHECTDAPATLLSFRCLFCGPDHRIMSSFILWTRPQSYALFLHTAKKAPLGGFCGIGVELWVLTLLNLGFDSQLLWRFFLSEFFCCNMFPWESFLCIIYVNSCGLISLLLPSCVMCTGLCAVTVGQVPCVTVGLNFFVHEWCCSFPARSQPKIVLWRSVLTRIWLYPFHSLCTWIECLGRRN